MINAFLQEIRGINLIDIGSSGNLDKKWEPLNHCINLIGFDPNEEECIRMMSVPHRFKSVKYLPYAIAGERKENILYKTKSIYCYSLLKPNTPWLQRFAFADLFDRVGEETISTHILADISDVRSLDVDVIKSDTQGLELPILQNSGQAIDQAILVETETGFVENYIGETTYSQMDQFMRSNDFLLFDINTSHRIPRNNVFKKFHTGREQLLWCEAIWIKDYVALAERNKLNGENVKREKILKVLILCALQGCIDYGYEIATLACDLNILTPQELEALCDRSAWEINVARVDNPRPYYRRLINATLRLLPAKARRIIHSEAERASHQKNLFRF